MSEVKGMKSRPNSIEFNKESNGNKRNSAEVKKSKSRPNSMEINGSVNAQNKRNSKEMKKSSSQDIQKKATANGTAKETKPSETEDKKVPLAEEEEVPEKSSPSEAPKDDHPERDTSTTKEEGEDNKNDPLGLEVEKTTPNVDSAHVEINEEGVITVGAEREAENQEGKISEHNRTEETGSEVEAKEEANCDNKETGNQSPAEESVNEQRESGGSTVTATAGSANGTSVEVPSNGTMATTAVLAASSPPKTPKYEIIAVRERHGLFRKAVPVMPISVAVIFCLLNVITPGIGTLCAGFTVLCGCPTEHDNRPKALLYNLVAAILQLITAPIVIGWVWSIMWGVTFVNVSVTKGVDDTIVTTHV